ncbi:MAG TPA: GDP-mannose 4,6-dehydratase [Thermoanaerobaculia bacterium]|nr:GDP-mannose 4,6-dehydratase [Thermoanaerobaculia bacterium]
MGATYLITGGAGFIGSHLSDALLAEGHTVLVVDDLSTGRIGNIGHLKGRRGFEYTLDTVMNRQVMAELVDRADYVFHLAAAVGVKLIVESPVRTIETNVRGTEVVLEIANKKKRPVLIASTSEVYGKASKVPFSEADDLVLGATTRGRWAYACSKALDEFLAIAYFHEKKLPIVIARLFNTVGPRQTGRYGMVLPTFVKQALAGRPITVYGDGSQTRCFGDVGDVVWALQRLIAAPSAYGEVFNVGSQDEISILDLAKLVKEKLESDSDIVFVPYDQAYDPGFEDMPRRVPDISKIRSLLGFEPRTRLVETIDRVADYYRVTA